MSNFPQSQLHAIKTPLFLEATADAQKLLANGMLEKIKAQDERIPLQLSPHLTISLSRKKLYRPIHLVRYKKLIHKQTGHSRYLIKRCQMVNKSYEYEEVCDFVCELPAEEQEQFGSEDNLQLFIKEKLQEKILKKGNPVEIQLALKKIRPSFYLKSFNLSPPVCNMFTPGPEQKQSNPYLISQSIVFGAEVPKQPLVQPPRYVKDSVLFKQISQYLSKRPCWIRNSLLVQLHQDGFNHFSGNDLKTALRFLTFTYRNGPWKRTYCAFGFNPELNHMSVVYQNVALKLKNKQLEDYEEEGEQEQYDPTLNQPSKKCMVFYQLCDINDPTIKDIINGKLLTRGARCTKAHGWLNSEEYKTVIEQMRQKMHSEDYVDDKPEDKPN